MEALVLEEVSCLNCKSTTAQPQDRIQWRGATLPFVICGDCGLKYMTPRPQPQWLLSFYQREFWQEKLCNKGYQESANRQRGLEREQGAKLNESYQLSRALRIFRIVKPTVKLGPRDRILEVGASFGRTLDFFERKTGCQTYAVEPSEAARHYLSRKKVRIIGRYMEELAEEDDLAGKLSLIIVSHVLENVADPLAGLGYLRRLLKADGHLFIDTTNLYYRNDINPYHMCIFTPETLTAMLARSGFDIAKQHFEDHPSRLDRLGPIDRFLDPYLAVVARPGPMRVWNPTVDIPAIVRDQQLGEKLFSRGTIIRKRVNNRLPRKLVRKMRSFLGLPQVWDLAREQPLLSLD